MQRNISYVRGSVTHVTEEIKEPKPKSSRPKKNQPTELKQNMGDLLKDIKIDPDNPKKFTVYTAIPYILAEAALGNIEVYPETIFFQFAKFMPMPLIEEKINKLKESVEVLPGMPFQILKTICCPRWIGRRRHCWTTCRGAVCWNPLWS